jgi:hypothetical protein
MSAKFLHIGFSWQGTPKMKELEPTFNNALDWVRYGRDCWIIYTTTDANTWSARIKPLIGPNDSFLISELTNLNTSTGWMPKWVWDWTRKAR